MNWAKVVVFLEHAFVRPQPSVLFLFKSGIDVKINETIVDETSSSDSSDTPPSEMRDADASDTHSEALNDLTRVEDARRKFEDIRDKAPVAYFSHDTGHFIVEINRRAMALFGLDEPRNDLNLATLFSPKSLSSFQYHLRKVKEGQPAQSIELVLQGEVEPPVTVYAETSRLGPEKFQTVMVDISAQKKVEFERSEFESKMQQTQKLDILYQLSGGIAHDFNNLLQVLEIQVDSALQLANDCGGPLAKVVSQIADSVKRGTRLTRRLQTFSRQGPLEKTRGDLNEFVQESIAMIDRAIGHSMTISFEPSSEPLSVWIDPVQLEQLLFNLCLNSRDAVEGEGIITIKTSAFDVKFPVNKTGLELYVGSYTKLSVSDNGSGIPKELQGRLFNPFVTSKEVGKGTGLGLTIVYSILKQHEGAIEIKETSASGTTFDIYLPRFRDSSVFRDSDRSTRFGMNNESDSNAKKTVLVADDERAIREALEGFLARRDVDVLLAKNGVEAIELLDRHPQVEWLLTDVVMPEKGGVEVCEHYRMKNSTGTVVLMSGHGSSVLDRDFLRRNNASYLQKPFDFSSLEKKLGLNAAK